MKILIHAHHTQVTESIKTYVEEKLGKLEKFFHNMQAIYVDLDILSSKHEDRIHEVRVRMHVSGAIIKASEATKDMYSSIDLVFDKCERLLTKHKEKMLHRSRKSIKDLARKEVFDQTITPLKVKRFDNHGYVSKKPMHLEDAMLHLESSQAPVFVFKNASNGELVNVLFKLNEDQFGLIETD